MRVRSREGWLVAVLIVVSVVAMVIEAAGRDISVPPPIEVEAERLVVHTDFCPPPVRGGESVTRLAALSMAATSVPIGIEPPQREPRTLPSARVLPHTIEEGGAVDVVSYGSDLVSSAVVSFDTPVEGVGGAACSERAADRWYFADGSSALRHDERLLVYNPFPDEAVVRVRIFTRRGPQQKANLADIAVPAQSSVGIRLNDFVRLQKLLATEIVAIRGRVVAWKALLAEPEDRPSGIQYTLGATTPAVEWFFPDGFLSGGYDEHIALLNPTTDEAVVTISLATAEETVQPARLLEVEVSPESVKAISLRDAVARQERDLGPVAAVVRSNDVGIVAERTVWYSTRELHGVTAEIGANVTSTVWLLGPPTWAPSSDAIVVLNPGTEPASVDVVLYRPDGRPRRPSTLQGIRVRPGTRFKIPIAQLVDRGPVIALVTATTPVVVERFSYSSAKDDAAATMGIPNHLPEDV